MKRSSGIYGVVVGNSVILLLIVSVAVLIFLLRNLRNSIDQLSKDRLRNMLSIVEEELGAFFHPVEENMLITRHRIEEGIFEKWDPRLFTSYFYPLIHNSSQVSSVMLATPEGKELLILDLDTMVMNRITDVTAGYRSRIIYYKADSRGILREISQTTDDKFYDPRSRPWFKLGIESGYDQITWTDPYAFYTTGEPGITAVLKWHNHKTSKDVMLAFDLLLRDVSRFTTRMQPSKNSRIFVITDDNRCIGLPSDPRFNHPDSIVKYSLQNIAELHIPIINQAITLRPTQQYAPDPFNFKKGDEDYWAGFRTLTLGKNQMFIIGSIVPESDFFARIRDTRRQIYAGFALILMIISLLSYSYIQKRRDNEAIRLEKDKNESLLLNTLPAKVVQELMASGKYNPERFDMISVMFVDIADFTRISATMDPDEIITELNDIYTAFDEVIEKHGCERIKTIGDAYMAVCGMPEPDADHAVKLLDAAFDILKYMQQRNISSLRTWRIRIGIHSGPVVGGIVGKKKYIYDIFGDTINTASRMESNAEPMRINISDATLQLIRERDARKAGIYQFLERPPQEVKGKGTVRMFFVEKQ